MACPQTLVPTSRDVVNAPDAEELRSVIATALATDPIDDDALRRGVWTLVRAERDAGARPANVIVALTALVDAAPLEVAAERYARLRQVILSCVEAYFGHLAAGNIAATSTSEPQASNP